MTQTRCQWPGCAGEVDETGYCDLDGHPVDQRPAAAAPAPSPSSGTPRPGAGPTGCCPASPSRTR
ncbi:hypothetical protein ACOBQX_04580 [Actinokineospora sp. G85]|uniref:hypothetical protein n=1 Tax=Actinokineospora sp. G85 TaxID=3406626 RepID=UPI003C75497B